MGNDDNQPVYDFYWEDKATKWLENVYKWLVNAYLGIGAIIGVIAALVTVYQIGDYFLADAHGNSDIFYGLVLTVMLSLVAAPLAGVVTCFLWGIVPVYHLIVWWQSSL